MSDREIYIEKMKAKLDKLNAQMDKLEAEFKNAQSDARLEYSRELDQLKERREDAADKLDALQKAGEGAYEDLKIGLESAFDTLGHAISSAVSRFK